MKGTAYLLLLLTLISCAERKTGDTTFEGVSYVSMQKAFHEVPDSVQLGVYWYWISGKISKEGVIKDLQAMKKAGMNRAFIGSNIVDSGSPFGKVKTFSKEWWDILHTAMKEATDMEHRGLHKLVSFNGQQIRKFRTE